MALLAIPAVSVWSQHRVSDRALPEPSIPALTQRLPVEIISAETDPKWVLVPINPAK